MSRVADTDGNEVAMFAAISSRVENPGLESLMSAEDPAPCPSFRSNVLLISVGSPRASLQYVIQIAGTGGFQRLVQHLISRQSLTSPGSPLWLLSPSCRWRLLQKTAPVPMVSHAHGSVEPPVAIQRLQERGGH